MDSVTDDELATAAQTDTDWRTRPPGVWMDPAAQMTAAAEDPWYRMMTVLNASIVESTARFYRSRGVSPVLMPITVNSVSSPMGLGSDSVPVQIDLLGDRIYLADSMQFQLEFLLRHGIGGAYYIMPTFRGEKADQTHLNQFFHSEAEIRGGLDQVMALVEAYVHTLTNDLVNGAAGAMIHDAAGSVAHLEVLLSSTTFPQITFDAAHDLLGSRCFEPKAAGVHCITRLGEQALIDHFGGAVWLTHPPHRAVPFYQKVDDRGQAHCADLLLGIGEVVGCGARHVTGHEVRRSLADHLIAESEYAWYIQMKDRYPLETAGFGMGLERYLLWVLRHDDIRDIHVMPRISGIRSWV